MMTTADRDDRERRPVLFVILGVVAGLVTLTLLVGPISRMAQTQSAASTRTPSAPARSSGEPSVSVSPSTSTPSTSTPSTTTPSTSRPSTSTPSTSTPSTSTPATTTPSTVTLAAGPSEGWGRFSATCPAGTDTTYGARTEPRRYEYVVCVASSATGDDGSEAQTLHYHGVDVDSGADIRLEGCLDDAGRYVFWADANWHYVVSDARLSAAGGDDADSGITLFRSSRRQEWSYGVAEEWGTLPIPAVRRC